MFFGEEKWSENLRNRLRKFPRMSRLLNDKAIFNILYVDINSLFVFY